MREAEKRPWNKWGMSRRKSCKVSGMHMREKEGLVPFPFFPFCCLTPLDYRIPIWDLEILMLNFFSCKYFHSCCCSSEGKEDKERVLRAILLIQEAG